ncbi:hypothetical protein [Curtobacterium flaccumfaciens]|uniref:hypothetical protein n=1 Tax=Curtobacterium flaccumfaciens TaxID=2035 RepID=UPI003992BEFB
MFEDITPESHHARESYAMYGLAMYKAQVMEAAVKQALIVAQVGDRKFQTLADYDAAFERHFRTVLGRLIEKIAPYIETPSLSERLQLALAIRNQLAHHFFWDHAVDATTWDGQTAMIAECERAIALFEEVDEELSGALRRFAGPAGMAESMTPDRIAEAEKELIRRRTFLDADRYCGRCSGRLIEVQTGQWLSTRCTDCGAVSLVVT